jgi:hypothetical protein
MFILHRAIDGVFLVAIRQSGILGLENEESIDNGEFACGCGQGAQAAALSSSLPGTIREAASQALQVTNFSVLPATVSNAAAQTFAPGPLRAREA